MAVKSLFINRNSNCGFGHVLLKYFNRKLYVYAAICILLTALSIFFSAQIPVLLEELTSHFLKEETEAAISDAAEMSGYTVAALICSLLAGFLGSRLVSDMTTKLRRKVFESIQKLDVQDIHRFSIPKLTMIISNDIETVSSFYVAMLTSGVMLPLTIIVLFPIMVSKSLPLIIVITLIMTVTFALAFRTFRTITPYVERGGRDSMEINNKIIEYIEGINVIRAFGGHAKHYSDFKELSDDITEISGKLSRHLSYLTPLMDTLILVIPLAIYAIAFFVMPSLDSDGQIELLSGIISFTVYAIILLTAVTQTSYVVAASYPPFANSKRSIESVLNYKPSMKEGSMSNPHRSGSIELRHVSFAYEEGQETFLKDINIRIRPGEKVAIIGPSASGKTTLLNLIQRIHDASSGSVFIDGMDVRSYSFEDLRSRISFCPQEPVIFSASAMSNILFGEIGQDASEHEVRKIMDECEVTGFLNDLPSGWGTVLTDPGVKLSEGQKQRICLARAIVNPAEIYLLDSSFSAIDAKMEARIMTAIWRRLRGRTAVLVTHKISVARRCDRIIVMENGSIIGSGTHEELMKDCEYYSELMALQSDWEAVR